MKLGLPSWLSNSTVVAVMGSVWQRQLGCSGGVGISAMDNCPACG